MLTLIQSRMMRRSTPILVALLLVATVALEAASLRTVTSRSGSSQLQVPEGWKSRPYLNPDAEIQVGDLRNKIFLVVVSDPKATVGPLSLEAHSKLSRHALLSRLTRRRAIAGPIEIEIGGRPALQFEFEGRIEGVKVAYFHTTIDGETAFHQIVAWTKPSKRKRNWPAIDAVIQSFREVFP